MGVEIERKFLVVSDDWRDGVRSEITMAQGYLSTTAEHTVRIRLRDDRALLTIKGRPKGLVRREFEYEIPRDDARIMLDELCVGAAIEKTRFEVPYGDHLWEVDVFDGRNKGLVVAEVELRRPDEEVDLPPWIGDEVTGQPRYYNARLVERPFDGWDDGDD